MTRPAQSADEVPVYFEAAGEALFGILTRPTTVANGLTTVMLSGGAWTPSAGRNRMWVRMARQVAATGYHSFRLDYRGVGESTGTTLRYSLEEPFVEDLKGALTWLGRQGLDAYVLLGTCFGARTALAAAPAVPGLQGLALFPPPVREFEMGHRLASLPLSWLLRKAVSRRGMLGLLDQEKRSSYVRLGRRKLEGALRTARNRSAPQNGSGRPATPARFEWTSTTFVSQLSAVADRRVPVLIVFGEEDDFYDDFNRGRSGPLGAVLERAGELVTITVVPGRVHGLTSSRAQDEVVEAVTRWLASLPAAAPHQA